MITHQRILPPTPSDVRVLSKIAATPGVTAAELWSAIRGMPPKMIRICIARLRINGYITAGGKTGPLTATEAGIEALRKAREARAPG
jgi:hypothetical protein